VGREEIAHTLSDYMPWLWIVRYLEAKGGEVNDNTLFIYAL
jgi:hypothetical protein